MGLVLSRSPPVRMNMVQPSASTCPTEALVSQNIFYDNLFYGSVEKDHSAKSGLNVSKEVSRITGMLAV
jgi:hypothetical protein